MKAGNKKLLTWLPRIPGMLFAVFISLFALDVFSEEKGFLQTLIALLMHLIPTFIIDLFHQISAYLTTAIFAASVIVLTF
jgi:hypothetical protein